MARDWDYAKLSKLAKQNGGPEALLDKIITASKCNGYNIGFAKGLDAGYNKGVSDTLCVVFIIVGVSLVTHFSYKLYITKIIKRFKETSSNKIEEAKKKLIDGIDNYNRSQEDKK